MDYVLSFQGAGGYFYSQDAADRPYGSYGYGLYIPSAVNSDAGFVLWQSDNNENQFYHRLVRGGGWKGKWIPFINAQKPQEYALPLAAGITTETGRESGYRITQDGYVSVYGMVKRSGVSDDIANTEAILTLPVGYRPRQRLNGLGRVVKASGEQVIAIVWIDPDGSLRMALPTNVPYMLAQFLISFYAA